MAIDATVTIEGHLPYQERLKLIDLACWRILSKSRDLLSYSDPSTRDLVGLFSPETSQELLFNYRQAERMARRFTPYLYIEPDSFWPDFESKNPRRYPGRFPLRYDAENVIHMLGYSEDIMLAGSSLLISAVGDVYEIRAITTINPLNIDLKSTSVLGFLLIFGLFFYSEYQNSKDSSIKSSCKRIATHYEADLAAKGIAPEHLEFLAKSFENCLSSPVMSSSPLTVTLNVGK